VVEERKSTRKTSSSEKIDRREWSRMGSPRRKEEERAKKKKIGRGKKSARKKSLKDPHLYPEKLPIQKKS